MAQVTHVCPHLATVDPDDSQSLQSCNLPLQPPSQGSARQYYYEPRPAFIYRTMLCATIEPITKHIQRFVCTGQTICTTFPRRGMIHLSLHVLFRCCFNCLLHSRYPTFHMALHAPLRNGRKCRMVSAYESIFDSGT